jgi:hypothetical protein
LWNIFHDILICCYGYIERLRLIDRLENCIRHSHLVLLRYRSIVNRSLFSVMCLLDCFPDCIRHLNGVRFYDWPLDSVWLGHDMLFLNNFLYRVSDRNLIFFHHGAQDSVTVLPIVGLWHGSIGAIGNGDHVVLDDRAGNGVSFLTIVGLMDRTKDGIGDRYLEGARDRFPHGVILLLPVCLIDRLLHCVIVDRIIVFHHWPLHHILLGYPLSFWNLSKGGKGLDLIVRLVHGAVGHLLVILDEGLKVDGQPTSGGSALLRHEAGLRIAAQAQVTGVQSLWRQQQTSQRQESGAKPTLHGNIPSHAGPSQRRWVIPGDAWIPLLSVCAMRGEQEGHNRARRDFLKRWTWNIPCFR